LVTDSSPRLYRFAPLDRTGWILGLSGSQCLLIGATVLTASALGQAGAPPILLLVTVVVGLSVTFATWSQRHVHEWLPLLTRHTVNRVTGRSAWMASVVPINAASSNGATRLPPFLEGLSVVDAGLVDWTSSAVRLGVVEDRRTRTLAGTLRVVGSGFALLEHDEQERLVQLWGDALGACCVERGPIASIRVSEWAAPGGSSDHERFAVEHAHPDADQMAAASYRELLDHARPTATRHEVLVTVVIDTRRVRADRTKDRHTAAVAVLVEELRRLASRLDAAGLRVDEPLSAGELATVLRLRCDPSATARLSARVGSLGELAGLVAPHNAGPLATSCEWDHVRVDRSLHRTYWIAEWPRLDVTASWFEPLLLHAGSTRSIAIHYEPVPPSRSQRAIERDATRLATDEEQRARTGFRIGARHRRAQRAVEDREAELVAGYAEFEFAAFVAVTALDADALERSCVDYEQAAAQAGLELRPLDGRHDLAVACTLPIGRGLAPRRTP
jgi:hypothetical protein